MVGLKRILWIFSTTPFIIWGRLYEVTNLDNFWVQVNRSHIAIVQLYCFDKKNKNKECDQQHIFLKNRLKAVSQNNRFSYAALDFMNVNVASCPAFTHKLSISNLPTLIVFVDGVPRAQKLTGYGQAPEVVQFIERTLGSEINSLVDQHADHDTKVEDAQLAAYANCCYPNYCWYNWGGCCSPCWRSWNWCW